MILLYFLPPKKAFDHLLSTAHKFYFLNNICANFTKYKLISSEIPITDVTFELQPSFNGLLLFTSFSLRSFNKKTSFQFSGVWFNLFHSPTFVSKQITNIYQQLSLTVWSKKLFPLHLAYLHKSVVLPAIAFRVQITFFLYDHLNNIVWPFTLIYKQLFGLLFTFPVMATFFSLISSNVHPYNYFATRLVAYTSFWLTQYAIHPRYALMV